MKNRLVPLILALALVLSGVLTACGDRDNGASPKMTPPTEGAVRSIAIQQDTQAIDSDRKSDAEDTSAAGDEASSDDSSDASSSVSSDASSDGASSSSASSASSDASSSAQETHAPNPAYQDGDLPSFTVTLTDTSDSQKTYSASCSYATKEEEYAVAAFFLPGGEYEVKVFEYNESKDKGEPLASGRFNNDIAADKRNNIQIKYTPSSGKIEVLEKTVTRTQ